MNYTYHFYLLNCFSITLLALSAIVTAGLFGIEPTIPLTKRGGSGVGF
jgi:hypothetical protein